MRLIAHTLPFALHGRSTPDKGANMVSKEFASADPVTTVKPVELLVCNTCHKGLELLKCDKRHGEILFDALSAVAFPKQVRVHPVKCISNCSQGCTIVLRGEGRWSYIYGNLDPDEHVEIILDGVNKYLNAADGLVPWRERPEHFRKNCIARIPPLEAYND